MVIQPNRGNAKRNARKINKFPQTTLNYANCNWSRQRVGEIQVDPSRAERCWWVILVGGESAGKTFGQNQKLKLKFNEIKQQQSGQRRSF